MTTRDLSLLREEAKIVIDETYRSGFERGAHSRPHENWQDRYQKQVTNLISEAYRTGARDERRYPEPPVYDLAQKVRDLQQRLDKIERGLG